MQLRSKKNVFSVLHVIFFPLGNHKKDLFAPQGTKNPLFMLLVGKCFSRFAHDFVPSGGSQNEFVYPARDNKMHFMTR